MVGKVRLPRKATKGKGKLWKKGQSCSFNPEFRKYRDEAKRRALYGYQGKGNLTKQALDHHNALLGNDSIHDGGEGDVMSVGDKTFVTTFSECSNPAFSRLLKNWQSKSVLHKEMLAVLAAVTEVIKSMGGKETETEYFAALMTTLSAVDTDESVSAIACLLYMVVKRLPAAVLRLKFSESCKIFVDLLSKYMNSDFNALLRNLLGCLHYFLKAQEPGEWTDSTLNIYRVLLEFATHQKPKVRKTAQEAVYSLLSYPVTDKEGVEVCHPAAPTTEVACSDKLLVSGGQSSPLVFHVLGLLKDVIGFFPKASVKSSCEMVLRLMTLSDAMVKSVCLKVFSGLFNCAARPDTLPADLNAKIIMALYDYQPNINDNQPLVDWLFVMEQALIKLYSSDPKLCLSRLPNFFRNAVNCWKSNSSEVHSAVAKSLKGVLFSCVEPSKPEFQNLLMSNPMDNPMSKMFHHVESSLSFPYHLAWKEVLHVLTTFFDVVGKQLYPVMIKCLKSLAELRDSYKFSHTMELEKAVGMAIQRMGPETILQAIPLQIDGESDKMHFPRSWMLPLLRDYIKETNLSFFAKYFLPLAAKMKNKVLELEHENKVVISKTYSVIYSQIWSLLPGFCTHPTDLKVAFKDIAKILGTALNTEPDLRTFILSGLRLLITKNLGNEENIEEMSKYAKNYLPILFNLYTTETKNKQEEKNRLAVYDTLKAYLQITDKAQCTAFFNKAMEKLKDADIDVFKQHSLLDINRTMLSYVELEQAEELYEYCKPLFQHMNRTIQKKSYAILRELCMNESEHCVLFVKKNMEQLEELLLKSLSAAAPSSKALRLTCIEYVLHHLNEENKDFIVSVVPEAVLCTKESAVKPRQAAFHLLVQIGQRLKQWSPDNPKGAIRDYMQMLLAGLAGSPHLTSATILAIAQVMHEFKDDMDSELINLLIENMTILLSSRSREIVLSALSFVKVLFAILDNIQLAQHVQALVKNITSISGDHQRHFRFKAKELFIRLIRKFGYEMISKMVPASYQKQLTNIRKTEARKARSRELKEAVTDESDDDMPKSKAKSDLIEDLLEDSEEEEPTVTKTPKVPMKRGKKPACAPWIVEEDENDIVDLLDPSVNKKILATRPQATEEKVKSTKKFPVAPDGRLIIREEEDEGEAKGRKRKASGIDDDMDIFDELPMSSETKKRKATNLSDDEDSPKYQPGGKGIHRNRSKGYSNSMSGEVYKAKKAGGDVKKGKYQPFAYIRLNKQALNKRKRGKLTGQFKGIVKAAKHGAQKGSRSKAKMTKKRK